MVNALDYLARNVHKFEEGAEYLALSRDVYFYKRRPAGQVSYTRQQWLDRRAELQNKPSWGDHPDAKCFVQQDDGIWFKQVGPEQYVRPDAGGGWSGDGSKTVKWVELTKGGVLGDWRDTLEKHPSEQAGQQQAAEFEPFTSVEDAQPAHTVHHAAFLHQGCQLLLSEPELVVLRTADGELIHCKPKECLIDPDVYGLAARLLADMSGHPVAPEHMRELAEQIGWRV